MEEVRVFFIHMFTLKMEVLMVVARGGTGDFQ